MKIGFRKLVAFLREKGYLVVVKSFKIKDGKGYSFASVSGKGIHAGFCTPNNVAYHYIRNRIAVDNAKCFDKWSKCPLVMKLPVDPEVLLKHLKHLGSKEGFKISNNFEYYPNNPYPYEMKPKESKCKTKS